MACHVHSHIKGATMIAVLAGLDYMHPHCSGEVPSEPSQVLKCDVDTLLAADWSESVVTGSATSYRKSNQNFSVVFCLAACSLF